MNVKHLLWLLLGLAWPVFAQKAATGSTNHCEVLKQSKMFAISGGFTGATTPEGHAVAALCAQTNTAAFRRLLQEKDGVPQLYGLLGLYRLNAPELKTALPPLLNSKARVGVLTGCTRIDREVGQVAREIQNNQWHVPAPAPDGPER